MKRITKISLLASLLLIPAQAYASPEPVQKSGACPVGYTASGNWCIPGAGAKTAITRKNSCPSGFASSGDYCIGDGDVTYRYGGNCPVSYTASGEYCVKR